MMVHACRPAPCRDTSLTGWCCYTYSITFLPPIRRGHPQPHIRAIYPNTSTSSFLTPLPSPNPLIIHSYTAHCTAFTINALTLHTPNPLKNGRIPPSAYVSLATAHAPF